MNKLYWPVAVLICPLSGLAGAAASDPFFLQKPPPAFEKRANSSLLFEAADRQLALSEQVQNDAAPRYGAAYIGGPRLHFGALPDNLALLDPLGPMLNEHSKRFLTSADFEKKMGRAVGILTIGILRETGSALGSQQTPALAMNTRPTTTFTSLSLGYALSSRSALMLMASYGKTEGIGNPDSLIAQVSSVRTMAFSVGLSTRQVFNSHDRFAVTLSIPAKVRSGTLQYSGSAPQSGDPGAPAFGAPTLNLRPTATERDLEFGYTTMFGRDGRGGKLTGAVMWRVNPGHDASARPDWLTGVRYSYGF
ncbi:hypothetical protein [Duganella violaceipulchra]|uniref:Transporter n=1 Tax=Duganella violaceipulchra TaxID=2849652 RepID=A0AA41L6D7_9BURK|nr:hypothetical protein [Duganella violaceicalia]MBV6320095.1 hypothetical protein [Duganella violaceicalia]MCP2010462.1 hypothetical protein [Duganella violaceicalia]